MRKIFEGETQALIYFDIFGSGVNDIPLGSTITSAVLRFYEYNGSWHSRNVYRMTADWDESSTWTSLGGGVNPGENAETSPDSVYRHDNPGSFFGIDVTSSLQAWADGNANLGWAIISQGTDGSDYASFINSNPELRPTLTVEYTEPSGGCAGTQHFRTACNINGALVVLAQEARTDINFKS